MIRTIQIDGFKSIESEPVELGRVNCFIGANGVGKSNILEAVGVLGAAASGKVDDESLMRRGVRAGMPGLFKSSFAVGRTPSQIVLSACADDSARFSVSLLNPLDNPNPAWSFKTELLSDGLNDIVSRGVRTVNTNLADTSGLAALKVVELTPNDPAAQLIGVLQNYAIYCPNTPTLRGIAIDAQTRDPVGLSGGLLAEAFADFRKTAFDGDGDDDLFASVLELLDWVADIDTTDSAGSLLSPAVPRSKHVLRFTDRFMKKSRNTLTAYDASEGALYILFTALLCLSPTSPRLLAIDNLDQALNPRLVTRLTEKLSYWLIQSGTDRQLLFTAHNPAVLDGLDLSDDEVRLFAVERNSEGKTRVNRITMTDNLRSLNATFPLSRLWLMGNLGAVPNV